MYEKKKRGKNTAEGAIQPLYVHCCGTSAPLPKSRANQPLHLTKPANQPFC
ncbi:hypothetical protein SLEP1_g29361 [Rubroshorea leprosula]|uniref:Uncharacterized protein n=1 Tax=Rubroshorea leprosula TaxID=152421 RepID=A0AAV5K6U2_9ROSI|nr:hypothetical protein SLEP1_g29361 [Rubroshorea leprosula]